MKKRIIGIILSLLMVITFVPSFFAEKVMAASGTGSISIDQGTVVAGNNVTVSVSVSASNTLLYGEFTMYYDASLFDFVSTTGPAATSAPSGAIPFHYDPSSASSQMNFTVTFKAKGAGQGVFSIGSVTFVVDDPESVVANPNISFNSVSCSVLRAGSDDATLSSLSVAGASLSPAFAKWTQDYTCYVSNGVTAVNISATSSQGGRVDISGNPGNLNVGSNYVTITSYAPNGKAMKYNINVYRMEPPTEPPTEAPTEPPTEPAPDVKVSVGGESLKINSGYDDSIIPEGFAAQMVEYNGSEVRAAVNGDAGLTLLYLVDIDGNGSFYTYDTKEQSLYKYIVIPTEKQNFILADPDKAPDKPEGCKEGKVTIRDVADVPVLISEGNKEFVYFYAINGNGKKGWYCYDTAEDTFQRVNISQTHETETTAADITESETETYGLVIGSLNGDIDNLQKENGKLKSVRNIVIASGGVLLAAAIVIIVVMAVQKSEKKHAVDIDTDGLADEEDYIEIEKDEEGSAEVEFAASGEELPSENDRIDTEEPSDAEKTTDEEHSDDSGDSHDELDDELLGEDEIFGDNSSDPSGQSGDLQENKSDGENKDDENKDGDDSFL